MPAPSLWGSGVQWGTAASDALTGYWGPADANGGKPTVYVSINGVLQSTVVAASWRLGRDGWFSELAPCTASISFIEPATGVNGDEVIITTETGLLWTGVLENISTSKRMDGGYSSTVTAVDGLGRHGLAKITENLGGFSGFNLVEIIELSMSLLGMDPITVVEGESATALPDLVNSVNMNGKTMLEYIQLTEQSSNALMTLQPDGSLLAVTRDAIASPELVTNGDFEVNTTGWSAYAGGGISRTTTTPLSGVAEGRVACVATQYSGTVYPVTGTFLAGRTYRLSVNTELISGESSWYIQLWSATQLAYDGYGPDTTFTATSTPTVRTFDYTPTIDLTDVEIYIGAIDAVPTVGVLAIDDVSVYQAVQVLDLVGINAPRAWTVSIDKSSVINHWSFVDAGEVVRLEERDDASVLLYGESTYAISEYMDDDYDHWSSAMRTAVASPRPVVTDGEFPIHDQSQALIHLNPLDWVSFDGDTWQVMSVEHSVTPGDWTLSITADVSQNYMGGAAEPDAAEPDEDVTVDTQTLTSTKSAVVVKGDSGSFMGNGAGDYLPVGLYSGFRHRPIIDFTTLSWPSGFISVKKATLNLRTTGQVWVAFGSNPKFYARRITESWSEGTYNAAAPSQYSVSNASVWPGPSKTTSGQTLKTIADSENNDISVDVTDILQAAHDAGNFHGIMLIAANEDSHANCVEFYSDDEATTSRRPELVVQCYVS
jgi:hypothetical protein